MPGGGERGGEPNPLPVKRPEAENRDIALKILQLKHRKIFQTKE